MKLNHLTLILLAAGTLAFGQAPASGTRSLPTRQAAQRPVRTNRPPAPMPAEQVVSPYSEQYAQPEMQGQPMMQEQPVMQYGTPGAYQPEAYQPAPGKLDKVQMWGGQIQQGIGQVQSIQQLRRMFRKPQQPGEARR